MTYHQQPSGSIGHAPVHAGWLATARACRHTLQTAKRPHSCQLLQPQQAPPLLAAHAHSKGHGEGCSAKCVEADFLALVLTSTRACSAPDTLGLQDACGQQGEQVSSLSRQVSSFQCWLLLTSSCHYLHRMLLGLRIHGKPPPALPPPRAPAALTQLVEATTVAAHSAAATSDNHACTIPAPTCPAGIQRAHPPAASLAATRHGNTPG